MGHIISRKYGNKGVEIAKKAYYNIHRKEIDTENLIKFLFENISEYCVDHRRQTNLNFRSKDYIEIFSEVLAKHGTNPNEFIVVLKEMIS